MTAEPDIEQLCRDAHREEIRRTAPRITAAALTERTFTAASDDRYRLSIPGIAVTLEVDRLRRDGHELWGELAVKCGLPGVRTTNGTLGIAGFNLSSQRSRTDRAKYCAGRAAIREIDWTEIIEDFCQRVLEADRTGQPAVDLRTLPPPSDDDVIDVAGLQLLRRHPSVLFGDGGAAKSYLALYVAGLLAERGINVALFDWELGGEDHRARLELLFPDGMPRILYARCERSLTFEADRLRRIVQENGVQFSVFDSVAVACDGPPESAEVAGRYFRAVRQIGGGSLHVAHVTKGGDNADQRPFGSAFWSNLARATWYVQKADESGDGSVLQIGLFNRKANLGRLRPSLGFRVTFSEERTTFKRMDVAEASPDLAGKLTVRERVTHLLRRGPLNVMTIADELDLDVNTVTQTVNRYVKKGRVFIVLDGENTNRRIGLLERDRAS